jgi:hypothetical protein
MLPAGQEGTKGAKGDDCDVVHAYSVRISQSLGGLGKRSSAVSRESALKCKTTRLYFLRLQLRYPYHLVEVPCLQLLYTPLKDISNCIQTIKAEADNTSKTLLCFHN